MATATTGDQSGQSSPQYKVNQVGLDRPWTWLARGWADFRKAAGIDIFYGCLFVVAGLVLMGLLYALDVPYVILPFGAGFMLVAPILAVGLYETSRRLGLGEKVTMATPLEAWQRNIGQIGFIGLALMLFLLAWIRIATLLFALFFSKTPPQIDQFVMQVFFSADSLSFLIVGTIIGAILAALVFAISVVSVPMLLDRDVNTITAIVTSVSACLKNKGTMFVWACLIVLFTAAGLVTGFIGLIVVMPLIGHATWHAYKDLVGEPGTE